MGLDRLRDLGRLRIDDLLAVLLRAALPLQVAGLVDAGLLEQFLDQVAVSAFERPDEDAVLGLALPHHVREPVVAGGGVRGG
jgi:hypothetical protein